MLLKGKKITLLVTGSIAAYKSAELVRDLIKEGADVRVGMSEAAKEFITPLTLETLSGNKVISNMFAADESIHHISLADEADVVLIAPATANTIAKCAYGLADDIVGSTVLATKAPVIVAPAMNVNMWLHEATRRNVATLKERGVRFVEPEVGELACGWNGEGRLAELRSIVEAVKITLSKKTLSGFKVIITAGPTQEPLDPIRFVSNHATGKMGVALSCVAKRRGADVSLIAGPSALRFSSGIKTISVQTAQEMKAAFEDELQAVSGGMYKGVIAILSAAVSDHRPESVANDKLKVSKEESYKVTMIPNPDILYELGQDREVIQKELKIPLKIVGFCAETGSFQELSKSALKKLEAKNADIIVANFASDAFAKDTNRVWIFRKGAAEPIECPEDLKETIAEKIVDSIEELL